MKTINKELGKLLCSLMSVAILATTPLVAQDDDLEDSDENVYELSPFVVDTSKDSGYTATNTLSGSRLNNSLLETPASISVLTLEFLEDIGATDLKDAVEYSMNAGNDIGGGGAQVGASTGNGVVGNPYNIQIRGYRNAVATRDYFPTVLASESFNIDRIEVARGPNSMVFGVGGPGGIINTTVKSALLGSSITDVTALVGTWNHFRSTLDINRELVDGKLAVRFNALYKESAGWKDFARDDQQRGALAVTYRPFQNTVVKIHTEFGNLEQNRVRPWLPVDDISTWEEQGSFYIPFGTPESPWDANDASYSQVRVASGGNPANGLEQDLSSGMAFERRTAHLGTPGILMTTGPLAGKYVWVGTRNAGQRYYRTSYNVGIAGFNTPKFMEDESKLPKTANPIGSGAVNYNDYKIISGSIDQKIGENLNLNLTVSKSESDIRNNRPFGFNQISYKLDVTSTLPTFTSDGFYNGTFDGPDTTGQGNGALNLNQAVANPFVGSTIVTYLPTYALTDADQDDIRFSASYHLDLGKAGDHTLMAFAQRSETSNETQTFNEGNVSANRPNSGWAYSTDNFPGRSTHIDYFGVNESQRGVPDPFSNPLPSSIMWGNPDYAFEDGWLMYNWSKGVTTIDSVAFAAQSKFLGDSLITTIGARKDKVEIVNSSVVRDGGQGWLAVGLGDPSPPQEEEGTTYSMGAVYHIPTLDWLSVYGNKSTNFQPQSGAQAFEDENLRSGMEIGALEGEGLDYGFKFRLFDGRVHATLGKYKVEQSNASTGYDGNINTYIGAIWTTILNDGPDTVETDGNSANGHNVGGSDTRGQSSEGFEFEVTANPTDNWRVSFNVSKSDNAVSDVAGKIGDYIGKHRSEWETWRSTPYDTGRSPGFLGNNTVGDLIDGLDALVGVMKASEGVTEVNIRPWNANLFTAYTFDDGILNGLTVGGGFNYRGEQILGVNPATLDHPVAEVFKGNAYYLTNAMLAYDFDYKGLGVRLQLNVNNLLDNDEKQVLASNYNTVSGQLEPFYYYLTPREVRLSAKISF